MLVAFCPFHSKPTCALAALMIPHGRISREKKNRRGPKILNIVWNQVAMKNIQTGIELRRDVKKRKLREEKRSKKVLTRSDLSSILGIAAILFYSELFITTFLRQLIWFLYQFIDCCLCEAESFSLGRVRSSSRQISAEAEYFCMNLTALPLSSRRWRHMTRWNLNSFFFFLCRNLRQF